MFFTSDTHYDHANIIRFCNRPFADLEEMNENFIYKWNKKIGANDEVWHLGDFCFSSRYGIFLKRLNGKKHLILGNHDKQVHVNYQVSKEYLASSFICVAVVPSEDKMAATTSRGTTRSSCGDFPLEE